MSEQVSQQEKQLQELVFGKDVIASELCKVGGDEICMATVSRSVRYMYSTSITVQSYSRTIYRYNIWIFGMIFSLQYSTVGCHMLCFRDRPFSINSSFSDLVTNDS